MKKFIIPALALLLGACSQTQNSETPAAKEPVRVTVVTVKTEKVTAALRYSGTIEAFQTIPLTFQTTGTVKEVLVQAGDMVHKGELLATLDETDAKSMYGISLSQYQQAKDAYDRLKEVHEKGSLPDIKWVEMESKLAQAKSSLDLAKNNLDKCSLFSPVNGMVGRRNTEPGMSAISLSSAPLELVDIRQVYVRISVPENEIPRITKGLKASFTVAALGGREFSGEVASVSPVADRFSRTYEAKILVTNANLDLKPGMVCDLRMAVSMEKEVLTVPANALSKDHENQVYAYLVNIPSKRAVKQMVQTGQFFDCGLEVVSGLAAGQIIVCEGKEKITDNCSIAW
jgi:RND family efflux transporter MFP subunit